MYTTSDTRPEVAPLSEAIQHAWRGAHRLETLIEHLFSDIAPDLGCPTQAGATGPSNGIGHDADRLSYRLHELAARLESLRGRVTSNVSDMRDQVEQAMKAGLASQRPY